MHKHWCEVEGHWFDCAEACVCECGLPMNGHDHSGCPVELRPCADHKAHQEQRLAEAAANSGVAAVEVGDDEEGGSIPYCECGCADVDPDAVIGYCMWCDHVYTAGTAGTEDDHFANHCIGAPEGLVAMARATMAKADEADA